MPSLTPRFDHAGNRFISDMDIDNYEADHANCQRVCRTPADVAQLLREYAEEEQMTVTWLKGQTTHYADRHITNKDGSKVSTQLLVQGPNLAVIAAYEAHINQLLRRADQINPTIGS